MTTYSEYQHNTVQEFNMLKMAWDERFGEATTQAGEASADRDMYHIPPALRRLMNEVMTEGVTYINEQLTILIDSGQIEEGQQTFDMAVDGMWRMSMLLANRMFQLGQHVSARLPFIDMAKCPCEVVFEEDLQQFMAKAEAEYRCEEEDNRNNHPE